MKYFMNGFSRFFYYFFTDTVYDTIINSTSKVFVLLNFLFANGTVTYETVLGTTEINSRQTRVDINTVAT